MTNVVLKSYGYFNQRKFSDPWVCKIENGKYNFNDRVGKYTGGRNTGDEGDLIVFEPVEGQIYGYGQKDYRGNGTEKEFAMWDGEQFIPCTIDGTDLRPEIEASAKIDEAVASIRAELKENGYTITEVSASRAYKEDYIKIEIRKANVDHKAIRAIADKYDVDKQIYYGNFVLNVGQRAEYKAECAALGLKY